GRAAAKDEVARRTAIIVIDDACRGTAADAGNRGEWHDVTSDAYRHDVEPPRRYGQQTNARLRAGRRLAEIELAQCSADILLRRASCGAGRGEPRLVPLQDEVGLSATCEVYDRRKTARRCRA